MKTGCTVHNYFEDELDDDIQPRLNGLQAAFPCGVAECAVEYSFLADDLQWCAEQDAWICENCLSQEPSWNGGISLAKWLQHSDTTLGDIL